MLTFSDPSSLHVWAPRPDGSLGTRKVGAIGITAPGASGSYDWDDWNRVEWRERRKAGWDAVAKAFDQAVG